MSNYDKYKNKSYNLRLPADLKLKFEIISKRQGYRFVSNAYEDVIAKYVEAYEHQYGEIQIDDLSEK